MPSLKLNTEGRRGKKTGSLKDVLQEAIERVGRDPDIDKSKSHLNIIRGIQSTEELIAYSDNHVKEMNAIRKASGGRALRKDAVRMCATIIKPPVAEMRELSYEEQIRLFDVAVATFGEIVGEDNIKTVAIHFDELGVHAHILWEPMTADGRLCAKDVHNREFFHRINEMIPRKLREAGYDVEDCEMFDRAEEEYSETKKEKAGRSSAQYKSDAEKKKVKIEADIEIGKQELADIRGEVLTTKQVTDVKAKKKFLRDDVSEIKTTDLKNLITTAVQVDKSNREKEKAIEQAKASEERAKLAEAEARKAKAEAAKETDEAKSVKTEVEKDREKLEQEKVAFQEECNQKRANLDHDITTMRANAKEEADQTVAEAKKEGNDIIFQSRMQAIQIRIDARNDTQEMKREEEATKERIAELKVTLNPLQAQADQAHAVIDKANAEAGDIRQGAYDDGYAAGKRKASEECADMKYQTERVCRDMKANARVEADQILSKAKEEAEKELEPKRFWDELMSVEGQGDFKTQRKSAKFWLEVEKLYMQVQPMLNKLWELEKILTFIPAPIIENATAMFKRLGRPRRTESEYVSTETKEPKSVSYRR